VFVLHLYISSDILYGVAETANRAISLELRKKYQSLLLLAYYSSLRIRIRLPLADKRVHSRSLAS
jgi:hypothetical protein